MDLLSRIASWLGENEATISAVVGIAVPMATVGTAFGGMLAAQPKKHLFRLVAAL